MVDDLLKDWGAQQPIWVFANKQQGMFEIPQPSDTSLLRVHSLDKAQSIRETLDRKMSLLDKRDAGKKPDLQLKAWALC